MTISEFISNLKFSDVISVLALTISGISILWNIYRDILLKPRLKVRVQISEIVQAASSHRASFIDITATNHGPGAIICESIIAKKRSFIRWLRKQPRYAFIMRDYTNPLSGELPKKLEVGEKITLLLPYKEKMVLARKPTHLGIKDSFGRVHWAEKNTLKKAIDEYLKDFSQEEWSTKSNK